MIMQIQREIQKKIEQKEEAVRKLEQELATLKAQLDTYREVLKVIDRSTDSSTNDTLRPGSLVDLARKALRQAGTPIHVDQLLHAIGKEPTKSNKVSLSSSIAHYVREGVIFTRPAPNTYGLKEFDQIDHDDLPENFGEDK
jgi:hypothetical protein